MQGDSSSLLLPASGDVATTAATIRVQESGGGGGGSNSGNEDKSIVLRSDEGDGRLSYGANRWPRQETLALLKIRSDMDAVFRDSSLKGPLWEEVSRKLADLGFHRSAKKCKEKFENVYKYHKRTKEGRTGKSEGKTYRFFDQIEALENHHHHHQLKSLPVAAPPQQPPKPSPTPQPPKPKPHPPIAATTTTLPWSNNPPNISHATVPSTTPSTIVNIITTSQNNVTPTTIPMPLVNKPPQNIFPSSYQNITSHLFSSSTSSSTASDEELHGGGSPKRKRTWKDFFKRLTKDVIKKQEELQRKFLETIEKRENERIALEESWRMQEMTRINREHEVLIQERTTAAAKDAAVIAFLQKISGQQNSVQAVDNAQPHQPPAPAPGPVLAAAPTPPPRLPPTASVVPVTNLDVPRKDNGVPNDNIRVVSSTSPSSTRWPKVEVEALIRLRTSLHTQYLENGPKGPLWEEISSRMQKLGYNRRSKRCKEKWENINKYFKKVKESNRKRSEVSKTCPYFHQLDALYKEKSKINEGSVNAIVVSTMEPVMVRPERQWPLHNQPETMMEINGREKMEHDDIEEDEDDDDGDTEEEDGGGGGGGFEVVASQPALIGNGE